MRERRRFPRRIVRGCRAEVIRLRRLRSPIAVGSSIPVRNLSLRGLLLVSTAPVRRGARLEILLLGHRSVMSFRVSGRVRWVDEETNRIGVTYYLIGVQFDAVATGARPHLERLMHETRRQTSSERWFRPSLRA